jgi:uncharacterized protein (DUF1330 family)
MSSAYIIANVRATDPVQCGEYKHDSSEYSRARQARAGAAVMRMVLVEGAG